MDEYAEHRFWVWFKENHQPYLHYLEANAKEQRRLAAILLEKLRVHGEHLSFHIIENMDDPRLIFAVTTNGNPDYFEDAEAVSDYAPYEMEEWQFYYLVPRWDYYAFPIAYYYCNIALVIDEIWFKPIHNPGDPSILAFTIYLKFYKKRHHKLPYLRKAVQELLFKYLGEECYTLDVRYFEIAQLPNKPQNKGLKMFHNLPTYIDWHKTKKLKYSEN
jgi:hypothetical protein